MFQLKRFVTKKKAYFTKKMCGKRILLHQNRCGKRSILHQNRCGKKIFLGYWSFMLPSRMAEGCHWMRGPSDCIGELER